LAGLVRNVPSIDPAQVGQATLRIAPQIQWNEDAALNDLQAQVNNALSEPALPVATAVAEDSSLGPTTLMDVAQRAGRMDTPRLQMSTKTHAVRQRGQQELAARARAAIFPHVAENREGDQRAENHHPLEPRGNANRAALAAANLLREGQVPNLGGSRQSARTSQRQAELSYLARHATQALPFRIDDQGGEHDVNEDASRGVVTKRTNNGRFGQILDQDPQQSNVLSLRAALPSEYLHRLGLQNTVFGDTIQVVGLEQGASGPVIVTEQRLLTDQHPDADQAEAFLAAHGFEPMPEHLYDNKALNQTKRPWYRSSDGVTITDAKPENFALDDAGHILPIDLIMGILPDDLLTATRAGKQYSKATPSTPLNALIKNTRAVAQQAARLLNQQLPGIVGPKLTFFTNPAELLASNYAAENSFTEAEIAQMQDAEGFYDNNTGHTIIFTNSIEVRPGESERAAVTRIILHERVGHDGFNALYQNDPEFAAAWDHISKDIPVTELDAIAADYPHLAADRNQLALEWFARAVEHRLHLKPGLAQRLWQVIRQFVHRLRTRAGFAKSDAWMHENALMELINKAREAAQNGTAFPTTAEGMRAQFTTPPNLTEINATLRAFNQVLAQGPGSSARINLPVLGPITIDWGNPGNPAQGFKQGFGLSHIIARRALVEGKDAAVWLQQLAHTLQNGIPGQPYGHPGNPRIDIALAGQRAVISLERHSQSESWLLTAFDDHAAGATSGNVHPSSATHSSPSVTHADVVAAAKLQLPLFTPPSRLQMSLGLHTLKTGSVLPTSLHEVMQSTQAERSALDNAFARVASMIKVGVEQAVTRTGQPLATIYDRVNAALDGHPSAMAVLQTTDPALAEATRRGRNMLDDMSQLIANLLPIGPARANIIGNMGHWMRRSYAAFDASAGWNYKTLMEAARAGKQLNGEDARQIVKDAASYLVRQDPSLQNQRDANGLPRDNTELAFTVQDLTTRDTWATSLVPGASSARKNVTSLVKRKDISPEIRRLMGEHTNPLTRFTTSASFQTQFVAKHQGLKAMREIILSSGLGSTQRTTEFFKQLAQNEGWNPLNDVWMREDLVNDLQSVATIDQAGVINFGHNAWTFFKALTANAKVNLVALNPISLMTNIYGGAVASIQTGDVFTTEFLARFKKAWTSGRSSKVSAKQLQDLTMQGIQDAEQALRIELIANGVLDSNLTLQDLQAGNAEAIISLFGDDPKAQAAANKALGALHGAAIGNAFGRLGGGASQLVGAAAGGIAGAVIGGKRIIDFNQWVASYTLGRPDAVFKILGYLSNFRTAQLAGIPNPQAWAAQRTRDTYPTYDKIPAVLRQASLLPVPFIGSFMSFLYEVGRNSIMNARYARQDLMSNNPHLRKMGAKRLAGQSLVWGGLAYGVSSALAASLFGWDAPDEEKKKAFMKWIAADYERDGTLTFKAMNEQGITYFNHAYLVPQASYLDFLRLAYSDVQEEGFAPAIYNSMGRALRLFGAGNNLSNTFYEAVSNADKFGNKITAAEGVEGFLHRADHVAKTYGDPGYAKFAVATAKALHARDKAELEHQANRFLGIRDRKLSWEKAAKIAGYRFQSQRQAVRDRLDEELRNTHLMSNAQASLDQANAKLADIAKDIDQFHADMATHFPQIRRHLPDANIPRTIHQLALTTTTDTYGKRITIAVTTNKPVR
jgi:hypothetical protein